MSDENFNTAKHTKDFWLFFIFADIIALAFFGYILYGAINARWTAAQQASAAVPVPAAQPVSPLPAQTPKPAPAPKPAPVVTPAPAPVAENAPAPAAQPLLPDDTATMPLTAAQPDNTANTAPAKPAAKPAPAPAVVTPKKQSVVVEPATAKTRKVTFKYFGPAKKVSLTSGFTMATPVALKKTGDHWEGPFVIYPGEYKYLFIVDGHLTLDPYAPSRDGRSVVTVK